MYLFTIGRKFGEYDTTGKYPSLPWSETRTGHPKEISWDLTHKKNSLSSDGGKSLSTKKTPAARAVVYVVYTPRGRSGPRLSLPLLFPPCHLLLSLLFVRRACTYKAMVLICLVVVGGGGGGGGGGEMKNGLSPPPPTPFTIECRRRRA